MKKYIISRSVLLVGFFVYAVANAFACNCEPLSDCSAYSAAKEVFVGRLVNIEKLDSTNGPLIKPTFLVERIFRGSPEKTRTLSFIDGLCERNFEINVDYIVFNENRPIQGSCNRTNAVNQETATIKFLESVDLKKPKFRLGVEISGLSTDQLQRSYFIVNNKKSKYVVEDSGLGSFNREFTRTKDFRISLVLAAKGRVEMYSEGVNYEPNIDEDANGMTTIKFTSKFVPKGCDIRQIRFIQGQK
jgi:hypothetical protein